MKLVLGQLKFIVRNVPKCTILRRPVVDHYRLRRRRPPQLPPLLRRELLVVPVRAPVIIPILRHISYRHYPVHPGVLMVLRSERRSHIFS